MKKLLLVCFALCVVTLTVSAQGDNEAKIRLQIESVAASMKTMQCDFAQTKYLRMLNDKMVSTGKMYYQQSDKLRWEYTSPYSYAFVLNGSKVLISKGSRSDVINVNQSKFFKEIARIMMNSVVGKPFGYLIRVCRNTHSAAETAAANVPEDYSSFQSTTGDGCQGRAY